MPFIAKETFLLRMQMRHHHRPVTGDCRIIEFDLFIVDKLTLSHTNTFNMSPCSDDMENFIPTKHPTTGQNLKEAPQYGAALKEKHRQYHYPKSRAPAEDSFDEDSSGDEH